MDGAGLFSGSSRALWRRWRLDDPPGCGGRRLFRRDEVYAWFGIAGAPTAGIAAATHQGGNHQIELFGCCGRVDR